MQSTPVEIIPAILTKNFAVLQTQLSQVQGLAPKVQIDVVDGVFAPSQTWPCGDPAGFGKIVSGEVGLPFWEDFDFQFDLMVADPNEQAPRFIEAGASSIILHAKSATTSVALHALQSHRQGDAAVAVGVALPSDALAGDLEAYATLVDFVQVMGIWSVGEQGEAFDEPALALVEAVRLAYPELPVQVDGGVSLKNAAALVQAGATHLVCGSAIFSAPDPRAAYKALYTKANPH